MANVKVSEMATATSFENDDYTMIVQSNKNKKITKQNMLGNIENNIGNLSNLTTTDKTSLVGAINENNSQITTLNTYSSTEQVVGTWTDGKPIYRKIYFGTNVSVSTSNTTISSNFIQNKDNIISMSSIVELGNYPYLGNTINWNTLLSPNGDLIMVAFETNRTFNKVNVIVEYTKTTD